MTAAENYRQVEEILCRIRDLLERYPLPRKPASEFDMILAAVPDRSDERYMDWAWSCLEVTGENEPVCTQTVPARDARIVKLCDSVNILRQEVQRVTGELSDKVPGRRQELEALAAHCDDYANQTVTRAGCGEVCLGDLRTTVGRYLCTGVIESCAAMLFSDDKDTAAAGAAILNPIRRHLTEIGITTPERRDTFDFDNYEPYFIVSTDREELHERVEAVRSPALRLGRSVICTGRASMYKFEPKE